MKKIHYYSELFTSLLKENTAFIPDVQALGIDKYPRLEIAKAQGIHSTFVKFADGKVYEYVSTDTLESAPAV